MAYVTTFMTPPTQRSQFESQPDTNPSLDVNTLFDNDIMLKDCKYSQSDVQMLITHTHTVSFIFVSQYLS